MLEHSPPGLWCTRQHPSQVVYFPTCDFQTSCSVFHGPRGTVHHVNYGSSSAQSPYPLPRRQEDVGYQRDDLHSQTFQQFEVPGWPVLMTNNLGSISPQLLNWDGQAIAPPHGSHVNEVAPTPTRSATVPAPETTLPGFSTGAQPAGAPALGTEAPPEESQSTTDLPGSLMCTYCDWTGNRRYSLMDHYKKHHSEDEVPDRGSPDAFTIYDGKRLAKRLVNREVTLEQATDEANASMRTKAVKLGKCAVWNMHYV
ncbi:hypothetical protein EDB85DRAFT_1886051 [Lactarius pseudohatsudake]|nr:hypothetical protein EDB85DRAFT_1886051 [Lactarius pseudohatsudake]